MEHKEEGGRPGRPPSAAAHDALLRAALLVFVEDGFAGMRLEHVAARAGVSKVTLYRRWASKRALVVEALQQLGEDVPIHETGDLRADLLALLRDALAASTLSPVGQILPRLVAEVATHPELLEAYQSAIMQPRLRRLSALIDQARARGEIRADVSTPVAVSLIAGPLFYHLTILAPLAMPTPDLLEQLVEAILRGIAP